MKLHVIRFLDHRTHEVADHAIAMIYALITHDFSVGYVAAHSNSGLPVQYRLAAVWGGHEGSLLLWVWTMWPSLL